MNNMFPSRPKRGENEEDLQRLMNEFHRERDAATKREIIEKDNSETAAQKKKSKFARERDDQRIGDPCVRIDQLPEDKFLLKSVIVERTYDNIQSSFELREFESKDEKNSDFPPIVRLDLGSKFESEEPSVSTKKRQSLFARSLKRNSTPIKPTTTNKIENVIQETKRDFGVRSRIVRGTGIQGIDIDGIHEENVAKLNSMSDEELIQERNKLLQTLNPSVVSFLTRKESKTKDLPEKKEQEKGDIQDRYSDSLEKEKRKWMTDVVTEESGNGRNARFDFTGCLTDPNKDKDYKTGLHHHGEEPDRAGYTLDELLILCRSTFSQQKVLALQTLSAVIKNFKKGLFDGVFDVNILDVLLKSGLVQVLRMGMDETQESIVFASCETLSECLHNEFDEICLELTFSHFLGYVQPSLPTEVAVRGSKSASEFEKEKSNLKDEEIVQLDVVQSLLRMDILDRISYVIDSLKPGTGTVLACLRILIRVCRHSQQSARTVLFHPTLLKNVTHHFLPTSCHFHVDYDNANLHGSPVHTALKLIRVIMSWDRDYAVRIVSTHKIGEALLSYLAYDPISPEHRHPKVPLFEGLKLVLESFKFWKVLLLYDLGYEHFVDFYPLLIRQVLYYENKVDLDRIASEDKYTLDHGSALIQVLETAVLCNHLEWRHFEGLVVALDTCLSKWTTQVTTNVLKINPALTSALNLLASTMRAVAAFYRRYATEKNCDWIELLSRRIEGTTLPILDRLFESNFFESLLQSVSKHSILTNTRGKSGKTRDPENLPSLGAILYRGDVVPSLSHDDSPFNLLTSTFYFVNVLLDLHKNLRIPSLVRVLAKFDDDSAAESPIMSTLTSNWFSRSEGHFWSLLTLACQKLSDDVTPVASHSVLFARALKSLSLLHVWDEALGHELCLRVVFNKKYVDEDDCERLKRLTLNEERTPVDMAEIMSLYLRVLFPSPSSLDISRNIVRQNGIRNLTQRNSGETLLPADWSFLPLLLIHNSRQRDSGDDDGDSKCTDSEIADTRNCLKWITLLHFENQTLSPIVQFSRLCTVFLAGPDLFLDPEIQVLTKACFERIVSRTKILDLDSNIPGVSSFFGLYQELLKQFSAVSYGNKLFAEFVTLPISSNYSAKYRILFWTDHADDLRIVTLKPSDLTLPMDVFTNPPETNKEIVRSYLRALLSGNVDENRNRFLYEIAVIHISNFIKTDLEMEKEVRKYVPRESNLSQKLFLKFTSAM